MVGDEEATQVLSATAELVRCSGAPQTWSILVALLDRSAGQELTKLVLAFFALQTVYTLLLLTPAEQ